MKKIVKILLIIAFSLSVIGSIRLFRDYFYLKDNVIRLHVVANSDSKLDQDIKLKVKDAVVSYLQPIASEITNKEDMQLYIEKNISEIEEIANRTLESIMENKRAFVSFKKESFPVRKYDTFSLPSGVYDSLRIAIGNGEGQNWWCVMFPTLCLPNTQEGFYGIAVSSGFEKNLAKTLSNEPEYTFRFYIMDCIGKLENLLFKK